MRGVSDEKRIRNQQVKDAILEALEADEMLSTKELAQMLGVSGSFVSWRLQSLREEGLAYVAMLGTRPEGGKFAYWALGDAKELQKCVTTYDKSTEKRVEKKSCTWSEVPRTDMSRGYGYVQA